MADQVDVLSKSNSAQLKISISNFIKRKIIQQVKRARIHKRVCEHNTGNSEYAGSMKGKLARVDGHVQSSLKHYQAASAINPGNVENIKQVAKSLCVIVRLCVFSSFFFNRFR